MSKRPFRRPKRPVHGILLLDKPAGLSSNQALQACRRLLNAAKAGHTGSLDPLATGLLPLCFGEATKIAGRLLGSHKAYAAQCQLGMTTTTDDAEGEVVATRPVPALDEAHILAALQSFVGRIAQVPPAYSALKRDGVPMYVRARRGEDVQLAPREVDIHAIEWLGRREDCLELRVTCGSGTYIRSLARDLGEKLGCGAHLTGLRRLWVDPFQNATMYTLDDLQARAVTPSALDALLLPVDAGLVTMPAVHLSASASHALMQGQAATCEPALRTGPYRAYADDGRLLALAEQRDDGKLHVVRGFNLPAPLGSVSS